METRRILAFSIMAVAILSSMGIAAAAQGYPDNTHTRSPDTIGPDHSLYGLRIAFENLDESFTFNETELLEKQVRHADSRLQELEQALAENRTDSAGHILELYQAKINQTEGVLGQYAPNGTGPSQGNFSRGLENAQEMIAKHETVLENLMNQNPGNTGLAHAYQNSIALEQRFEARVMQNGRNGTGPVPGGADSMQSDRIQGRSFAVNTTPGHDRVNLGDTPGNRTRLQNEEQIRDGDLAGNRTGQPPAMNQTGDASGAGRNQGQGLPPTGNQTADNRQQPGQGAAHETQGETHTGNGAAPDHQSGNTGGNNNGGGAGTGISRSPQNQGAGQGQQDNTMKPRNR